MKLYRDESLRPSNDFICAKVALCAHDSDDDDDEYEVQTQNGCVIASVENRDILSTSNRFLIHNPLVSDMKIDNNMIRPNYIKKLKDGQGHTEEIMSLTGTI